MNYDNYLSSASIYHSMRVFVCIGCHNAFHGNGNKSTLPSREERIRMALSGHNLTESVIDCVVDRVSLRIFMYLGLLPTGIIKFPLS